MCIRDRYECLYDDAGEEIYDETYSGFMEDLYDDFYGGVLEDAYEEEPYAVSVSYTHLDVYKRQQWYSRSPPMESGSLRTS